MLIIQRPIGPIITGTTGIKYVRTGSSTFFDEAYSHANVVGGVEDSNYGGVQSVTPAWKGGMKLFTEANIVHNGVYGSNTPHPTQTVAAYDNGVPVYMDQVTLVSNSAAASFAKVPETNIHAKEYVKRGFAGDGGGHAFAWGTCMWLRACNNPGEIMGSACSATLSNVVYSGFCFVSDVGTLECGRLSASDDEYGDRPVSFDSPLSPNILPSTAGVVSVEGAAPPTTVISSTPGAGGSAYRCPTGSPAKSLGSFVSKRPLSAGCMISTDASYDALAEVHVPDYCAQPADFQKGCMLPTALNFDPTAKQVGECRFPTRGCMDPNAVNYNPNATMAADWDKPCIARIEGCTLASSVLHTDVLANALSSCVIAIEGCMDSTARNYDPAATYNNGTWCIPVAEGCMMPLGEGLSANYDFMATKHDDSKCVVARSGCNLTSAINTDPATTIATKCYFARLGCLNPAAINFGCPSFDYDTTCGDDGGDGEGKVTQHTPFTCKYTWNLVPSPPKPPTVEAPGSTYTISSSFHVESEPSFFTEPVRQQAVALFKTALSSPYDSFEWNLTVQDASALLTFSYTTSDPTAADTLAAAMSEQLPTQASLQSAIGDALGVTVLSAATTSVTTIVVAAPPPPAESPVGYLVWVAIGLAAALIVLLIVGGFIMHRRRAAPPPVKVAPHPGSYQSAVPGPT